MARVQRPDRSDGNLAITVRPFGPTAEELSMVGQRLLAAPRVRTLVRGGSARLLFVEPLEEVSSEKSTRPVAPRRFRATIYDDTNERTVLVEGDARAREIVMRQSAV